jgi:hypothetical protein
LFWEHDAVVVIVFLHPHVGLTLAVSALEAGIVCSHVLFGDRHCRCKKATLPQQCEVILVSCTVQKFLNQLNAELVPEITPVALEICRKAVKQKYRRQELPHIAVW